MRAPGFWRHDGVLARLLSPLGAVYGAVTARRVARPGWQAPVPVLCCGNATAGGTGKTTLALDLGARLIARGLRVAFLTRGYGGKEDGAVRVEKHHSAADVGDEALLLAQMAPCFVGADREAGARAAVADGAQVLVMDDGLQNPGLVKSASLLVVDGAEGFGNGFVIPAGPLRETVMRAATRCRAAVLIGEDRRGAAAMLPPGLALLRASLRSTGEVAAYRGRRVFAFAGIGRPEKFFETLEAAGVVLAGRRAFADHHAYGNAELQAVLDAADGLDAVPVTTPKDAVRLPMEFRVRVGTVGVRLVWEDAAEIEVLLDTVVGE
jgi:tetraacyldisaccharide 4'-kinase